MDKSNVFLSFSNWTTKLIVFQFIFTIIFYDIQMMMFFLMFEVRQIFKN